MIAMAKKKSAGRPRKHTKEDGPRSGQAVHVYLDPILMTAFERFRQSMQFPPKKTEVLERSLREFLEREGFWPPKKSNQESP